MVLIAVTAASLGLLVGYATGSLLERHLLREERESLRKQGEMMSTVLAYKTPQEAAKWTAALAPKEPQKPTEADEIKGRIQQVIAETGVLSGANVTVDRDSKLVTIIDPNPANPIAIYDRPATDILRWIREQE